MECHAGVFVFCRHNNIFFAVFVQQMVDRRCDLRNDIGSLPGHCDSNNTAAVGGKCTNYAFFTVADLEFSASQRNVCAQLQLGDGNAVLAHIFCRQTEVSGHGVQYVCRGTDLIHAVGRAPENQAVCAAGAAFIGRKQGAGRNGSSRGHVQCLPLFDKGNATLIGKVEVGQIAVGIGIDKIQLVLSRHTKDTVHRRQCGEKVRKRRHFFVRAHIGDDLVVVRSSSGNMSDDGIVYSFVDAGVGLQIHISQHDFPDHRLCGCMIRDIAFILRTVQHGIANRVSLCAGQAIILNGSIWVAVMRMHILRLHTVCNLPIDRGGRPLQQFTGANKAPIVLIFRMPRPHQFARRTCGAGTLSHRNDLYGVRISAVIARLFAGFRF